MGYTAGILVVIVVLNSLCCLGNALSPSAQAAGALLVCQDPGTPLNGRKVNRLPPSFLPGVVILFACDFTYRLVGSENRTCLANGSWSGVQPFCEKYMCDELDAMPPKNGKRTGTTFTIGSTLKFKCSSEYILIGQKQLTCRPNGQWSSEPPRCKHRCSQVPCSMGKICKIRNLIPTCVCRKNLECPSRWDPVCGSDARIYNNECILKATACRNGRNVRTVSHSRCLPGDRCNIFPVSKCRAAFDVYFYNVTAGQCEHMIAGGCHPSGWNGFSPKRECKKYCQKDVCERKPKEGPCDLKLTRWYYNAQTNSCKTFQYGGCFGNANNFRTLSDCEKRCV